MVKQSTPIPAIDVVIGDEEQNVKQENKRKETGSRSPTQDIYILLLKSNHSRQHPNVLYREGVRRRGRTGNHGKVGVKRKWWALAHPPYSPQENGRQTPRVEPL